MLPNNAMEKMLRQVSCMKKIYTKICFRTLQSYGFSPSEIDILVLLSTNLTINTSKQLALELTISKSLVARSVESLIKRELIAVVEDQKDKRMQRLFLTDKSQFFIQKIKERQNEFTQSIVKEINIKDLEITSATISKITENMTDIMEKECLKDE